MSLGVQRPAIFYAPAKFNAKVKFKSYGRGEGVLFEN